jgi:DNA replicative helicase MCM subunit Mcm2 (Cdc46/Mcm family)
VLQLTKTCLARIRTLSEGKPGLLGAITARAEAQVLRLSCIYALLDCSNAVGVDHLKAALALWRYCDESARWIFETGTGNKNADKILAALKAAGQKGLTRLQITNEVFNRHVTKFEIDEALRVTHSLKLAVRKLEDTATRPAERWIYKDQQREVCEESKPGDGETGDTSHSSHPPPSKNASSAEPDTEAETLIGDELGVARL